MVIYSSTLDTQTKVKAIYGGTTWTKIEGMMLIGANSAYPVNSTGGSATHTITTSEMPSHTHAFTGTTKSYTSGNNSVNHAHSIPKLSGTAASSGEHYHSIDRYGPGTSSTTTSTKLQGAFYNGSAYGNIAPTKNAGAHTHSVTTDTNTTGNQNANHTHTTSITPEGTNSSTGSGTAMNIMPPYKAVYIWERTA